MGKNKEAEVRYGVAHVRKGRKGKRWLRQMDLLRVSLNGLIQLPLMLVTMDEHFFGLGLKYISNM